MKFSQTIAKLGRTTAQGYNPALLVFESIKNRLLLETSGRWVSERISFNSRRVLLSDLPVTHTIIKIANDDLRHILYSEQRNISQGELYLYDYTLLDETDSAQTVTFAEIASASGMGGTNTETLSVEFPVHMVRFASTADSEANHVDYSRLYAFLPGDILVDDDMELLIDSDRYVIKETQKELLCTRLYLVKR